MRTTLCALLALGMTAGCEAEPAEGVTVPLSGTGAAGTVYVLSGARFRIRGPRNETLNADETSASVLSAGLPVGDYTVELLDGWQLVRLPDGTPMDATLASPNPQDVTIHPGMRTTVTFVFDVRGELVAMTGDGDLDIGFEVRDDAGGAAGADGGPPGGCMEGDMRPCGSGVGRCEVGYQQCIGGAWTACMGGVGPVPEACSGLDEDCDGAVDEGVCAGVCMGQPAGTICRPAAGPCDVPDLCDGVSPDCAFQSYRPPGTLCRVSIGVCDIEDYCTGTGPDCPPDAFAPDGSSCGPSNVCMMGMCL